ncbi:MarR family winged helix-turn-helix transcriptional regulator [Streptomyces sp. NPDC002920]
MNESSAALADFERSLAAVVRLLAERETMGDLAERCGHDLPPASWTLLEYLDAHGQLRVSELAACYGVDVSSVTPRIKTLESAGLIARTRHAGDGRVHLIEITEVGSEALHSLHAARRELLAGLLGTAITIQDMAAAGTVLAHIAHQLDSDRFSRQAKQPA